MNNSEGQTQEPVGGMKNEWQLCPKCNGQGSVSKPPWVPGDVHQWSSTSVTYPCDVCNGTKIIACLFTPPPAPIKTEGEDEKNPLFKMWDNDEVPDLTSATNEQKDKLINGLLEISAKEFLKMFMALGLSSHIETKVINYANGEEFMFSFKKIAPPSPVGIDVEELATAFADSKERRGCSYWQGLYNGFKAGYAAAQSSQEDLETRLIKAMQHGNDLEMEVERLKESEAIGERKFTLKEALEIWQDGLETGSQQLSSEGDTIWQAKCFKDKFGIEI